MKNKIDKQIIMIVSLLTVIGLIMVFSVSSVSQIEDARVSYEKFFKQIIWVFTGLTFMYGLSMVSYNVLRKHSLNILMIAVFLLILTLAAGKAVNGARRWLDFGFMKLQPLEFAKIAIVIFMADRLSKFPEKYGSFKIAMVPVLILLSVFAMLLVLQPDFSGAAVIVFLTFILLYLSPMRWYYWAGLIPVGLLSLVLLVLIGDYRMSRIYDFISPLGGPYGSQPTQGLMALGSGGLSGVGYAASKMKLFFLKAADTDFILAILGEEFGLIGITVILFLFLVLFMRLFKVVYRSSGDFQYYLAAGLMSILLISYLVNMAVVLRLIPVTGIPLPFISYGGSHIIAEFIVIGILLNLAKDVEFKKNRDIPGVVPVNEVNFRVKR